MNTVKQIQCHSLKSRFSTRFAISNLVDIAKHLTTPQSESKQRNMLLGAILSCSLKCLHVFFGLSQIIPHWICSTSLDVFYVVVCVLRLCIILFINAVLDELFLRH